MQRTVTELLSQLRNALLEHNIDTSQMEIVLPSKDAGALAVAMRREMEHLLPYHLQEPRSQTSASYARLCHATPSGGYHIPKVLAEFMGICITARPE